jgi:hypothetical protein
MTPLGIAFGLAGWMAVGAVSVYALHLIARNLQPHKKPDTVAPDLCSCGCELADWPQPEHDFLADQPAEILGDIHDRFWQIADDIRRSA